MSTHAYSDDLMNCNQKYRLGFLDGIQARQQGSKVDTEKLFRVKGKDYASGYLAGVTSQFSESEKIEKGQER